ncbi:MAG: hypothetical protein BGO67_05140 [Alphaproteobacteria bacterium 41-28]|nr:MAG: hypothetical protein BGO67_05140 [Alphaproteobacteria bacterium 41-28]
MQKTGCKFDSQTDLGSIKQPDPAIVLVLTKITRDSSSWVARFLKKFALVPTGINHGSFDPCGLPCNLPKVGPPLLGYFFAGRSYFNKKSLKKQIRAQQLNEK